MAKTSPAQFMRQVKQEILKVTWPTKNEALVSTGVVLVMTSIIAMFFFFVDQIFGWVIKLIFGI
ncbi:MAG: preprotein translocase subunit SecE [Alphaproteobacteria bacterium]